VNIVQNTIIFILEKTQARMHRECKCLAFFLLLLPLFITMGDEIFRGKEERRRKG